MDTGGKKERERWIYKSPPLRPVAESRKKKKKKRGPSAGICFKYKSQELNNREGINYSNFWLFSGLWGVVPLHEPSQHELHPGQSPAVQLCLLTAISWCFQDPGICQSFLVFGSLLLLFCVINRCIRKESGGTASHMAPGPRVEPVSFWWTGRRFQNNQMLPETASLQGRMMSGLLFLATGLFNRWKDWLLLKLQGSAPCMWGKVSQRESVSLRQVWLLNLPGVRPPGSWVTWQASQILCSRKPLCVESGQRPLEISPSTNHWNCQRRGSLDVNWKTAEDDQTQCQTAGQWREGGSCWRLGKAFPTHSVLFQQQTA